MATPKLGTDLFPVDKLESSFRNIETLLIHVGAIWKAHTALAFEDQRLGEWEWSPQYPGMDSPWINVAGALSDLNQGSFVKPQRFEQAGPGGHGKVLHDTGQLKSSIDWSTDMSKNSVKLYATGFPATYAGFHQWGSPPDSSMEVKPIARDTLARQLKTGTGLGKKKALKQLGFLFQVDSMETSITQRPFLGFTDEFEKELRNELLHHVIMPGVEPVEGH